MRKRVNIALAVSVVAALSLTVWRAFRQIDTSDPVYQGKRLSQWLDDLGSQRPALAVSAWEAVRQIGTNAVPLLLREASVRGFGPKDMVMDFVKRVPFFRKFRFQTSSEHRAKALRGFCALGETGALAVAQGLTNSDRWVRHGCVGQWGICSYYPAIVFGPLLTRLKDPEPMVRARAANAVGMLQQQPSRSVPALIELLQDKDDWARCMAALGLDLYGDQAKPAVPALLSALTNCSSTFRPFGTRALVKIDPQAAAKAGIR